MTPKTGSALQDSRLETQDSRLIRFRVLFLNTSLPVGGAEVLLANLVRRMDQQRFQPELCCLKELGPLGEPLSQEFPTFSRLLRHKYDLRVLPRLVRLCRQRRIDAVVTVGAGDKMFWGRLAAWMANVPVILSALHSTGWPDVINWANRRLTPLTDGFIAVARPHADFLINEERFPAARVRIIHNGVDTERFRRNELMRATVRDQFGIPHDARVCGIVAALRPEKNHALYLEVAAQVRKVAPNVHFLIIGDGPLRQSLEQRASELGISGSVHFAGARADIPDLLSAFDVFSLTSQMEANPVSILEAMSCEIPVVAPRVGSIPETVQPGKTGFLVEPGNVSEYVQHWTSLLNDSELARRLGRCGRQQVEQDWSLDGMVNGYQDLIEEIYQSKAARNRGRGALRLGL